MFEYFAAGKPIITDCEFKYDLVKKYNAGVVIDNASSEKLAKEIIKIKEMDTEEYKLYCTNAIKAAEDYDYKVLANKLISIVEN
jgi:glycosyltransferase involved in cell wall biosynthesis